MKVLLCKFMLINLILTLSFVIHAQESICYGTTKKGALEHGVKLPLKGPNFSSYSEVLWIAGRTYVHSQVKKILLESYKNLEKKYPDKKFVYGETGFKKGGIFKPHKTHQNGLSVDHMVPVLDLKSNKSVPLPTHALNKWGYGVEFNEKGVSQGLAIDFEALAALIMEIYTVSLKYKIKLWRVIFAPDLQKLLYETSLGETIKEKIKIPTKKSWVRHDEHIHIDFKVPCEPSQNEK